jgi:hypothetical protein
MLAFLLVRLRWIALLAGAVALALLWIVLHRAPSRRAAESSESVVADPAVGEVAAGEALGRAAPDPPGRPDRRRAFELGARVRIPPPVSAGEAHAPPRTHHPRALAPGGGGFVDRREDAGADNLMSEIPKRMAEVREAASHCLDGWVEEDPSLAAGVMLDIRLDEQGLKEVSIMDRAEAPSGPLACLTNAVYPIDWGGLTKAPLRVTVKVGYARDAAAEASP